MTLIKSCRNYVQRFTSECLALVYVVRDRRVRWYAKLVIMLPLGYLFSPIDLIPDAIPVLGSLDDIMVIRLSYVVLHKIIDVEVLKECSERADLFMKEGKTNKLTYIVVLAMIWVLLVTILFWYFTKKYFKYRLKTGHL